MKDNIKKKGFSCFLCWLFQKLSKIALVKEYLISIRSIIMFYRPGTEEKMNKQAVVIFFLVYGTGIILFGTILVTCSFRVLYGIAAGVVFFLWSRYVMVLIMEKMEKGMLKDFQSFLNIFYHKYTSNHEVEEAVLESAVECNSEIVTHLERIYDLLLQEDMVSIMEYKKQCICPYFYAFLIYSFLAVVYGDGSKEFDTAFLKNLNILEQQVYIEILKRERMHSLFSGLIPITLIPILSLSSIEKWGIYNIPQLSRFYGNRYGCIACYLLILITVICYEFIMWMKSDMHISYYQSPFLKKTANMKLVKKGFQYWAQYHPYKVENLNDKLRRISARISLEEFCALRIFICVLVFMLSLGISVSSARNGNNQFFFFLILSVIVGICAFWIPVWGLAVKCYLLEDKMEQEVIRFYGMLLIFADLEKADVPVVLEWMEMASVIFEPSLTLCVNEINNNSDEALEELKKRETYSPFQKITETLVSSEETGMKNALGSLAAEQKYLLDRQKQNNEIRSGNRGALGRVIAFIPMFMAIGLYLILPFVLESLTQLRQYINGMRIW